MTNRGVNHNMQKKEGANVDHNSQVVQFKSPEKRIESNLLRKLFSIAYVLSITK